MTDANEPATTLATVRDWLRYAVSRFNEAELVYGHGTATALDEAAFLVLETLRLPVDQLEPWLDARLLMSERAALAAIIEARVATRKPGPYLTQSAYIQGHRFYVDERTIVPRSFIAELLLGGGLEAVLPDGHEITTVLDLCTGGGSLAILAALQFPQAQVTAIDISAAALDVARRNVRDYDLEDRIKLAPSDLFAGLRGQRFDLIVSNPPYVTEAAVGAFPPEYAAEPRLAHAGGDDGMDLVRKIIASAADHLTDVGTLVVEVGQGRAVIEGDHPELPFIWLDAEEAAGEVFALPAAALGTPQGRGPGKTKRGKRA